MPPTNNPSPALEEWSRRPDGGDLARLLRLALCFKRELVLVCALALLATALGWSTALFVQEVVDGRGAGAASFVSRLAIAVLAAHGARALIAFARMAFQRALDRRVELELATIYLRKIFSLPPARLLGQTNRLFMGMIAVRGLGPAVTSAFHATALDLAMFAPTLVMLGARDARLTAATVLLLPIYAALSHAVRRRTRARAPLLTEEDNRTAQHQIDFFGDPGLVKGYLAEERAVQTIRRTIVDRGAIDAGLGRDQSLLGVMTGSVTHFVQVVLLWVGGLQLASGQLTAGELMFFYSATGLLTGPIERLAGVPTSLQNASTALARFDEIMSMPSEREIFPGRSPVRAGAPAIELRELTFGYDPEAPVIRGMDLAVPRGATVAVVGESGSGKTTLVGLLLAFLVPQRGEVLIDGVPLRDLDVRELRRLIGWVPQRTSVFHDTIFENIRMGRSWVTAEDVERAARTAQAHDFIAAQPQGYQTLLALRADQLSGGQAQRLAIARALAGNPRLLVLDEATSNLDIQTEQAIVNAMAEQRSARTTLLIAHRLSTIAGADSIVVLDRGRISEQGNHSQLVSRGGMYRAYLNRQLNNVMKGWP